MFVINSLGIIFKFTINFFFHRYIKLLFFVMYSSTWNVNMFKVSNLFHVYTSDVQCNSPLSIIIMTT
jgi:hypothetical protein